MNSTGRSFSALVRWRSRLHPEWEVDTRHPGFPSAEAAALAANGLGTDGFEELRLEREVLFVVDLSGRRASVEGDIALWTTPTTLDLPEDFRFERVDGSVHEMSRRGLDGGFEPRRFRVIDDGTTADVDARLLVGRSRVVVLVSSAGQARVANADVPIA